MLLFIFSDEQLKLTMQLSPKKESAHAFKIFFRFNDLNRGTPLVVDCSVKVSFISDMTAELSSTGGYFNYRKKKPPMKSFYRRGAAIPGVPLPGYLSLFLSPPPTLHPLSFSSLSLSVTIHSFVQPLLYHVKHGGGGLQKHFLLSCSVTWFCL